jgi:hypothetical protein
MHQGTLFAVPFDLKNLMGCALPPAEDTWESGWASPLPSARFQ